MEKKSESTSATIIKLKGIPEIPVDYAISICMQNLFATFGENKVKASLKELFNLDVKVETKKVV